MSLPKSIIQADFQSDQVPSGLKPGETVDRLAIQQLAQTIQQVVQLSKYSQGIFLELNGMAKDISQRISSVSSNLGRVKGRVDELKDILPFQADIDERVEWKQPQSQPISNFFVPQTENEAIKKIYDTCDPGPNLAILDSCRTDGKSSLSFYTYPAFFAEEWKRMMSKEESAKKQRQDARIKSKNTANATISGRASKVSQIHVKKYSTEGALLLQPDGPVPPLPKKSASSAKVLETISSSMTKLHKASSQGNLHPPPPVSASMSNLDTDSNQRAGLMNAIKGKQFSLKKVARSPAKSIARKSSAGVSYENEVAQILMRRAALEMSDEDDSEYEYDDEWE